MADLSHRDRPPRLPGMCNVWAPRTGLVVSDWSGLYIQVLDASFRGDGAEECIGNDVLLFSFVGIGRTLRCLQEGYTWN